MILASRNVILRLWFPFKCGWRGGLHYLFRDPHISIITV
jgi:hypothetical protein